MREVRTDRERETRSGRTVVLGSFPPSLRPVILPSRRSGGSEEPSDRREERTRGVRDRTTKGRKGRGKGTERSLVSSVTHFARLSVSRLPFPSFPHSSLSSVRRSYPPSVLRTRRVEVEDVRRSVTSGGRMTTRV